MQKTSTWHEHISKSADSVSNTVQWVPAAGSFPMESVTTGSTRSGLIVGAIGFFWTVFIIRWAISVLSKNSSWYDAALILIIEAPGLMCLLYFLSQLRFRYRIEINRQRVTVDREGLLGKRHWIEPISNYQGVLKQHRYLSSSTTTASSSRMSYMLKLSHTDKAKEIILFRIETRLMSPPPKWEQLWRHYAEALQLPMLEETAEGIISLQPDQADTPLQEKIPYNREKAGYTHPASAPLGKMLKARKQGNAWWITFYPAGTLWRTASGLMLMGAMLMGANYFGIIDRQVSTYFLLSIPVLVVFMGISFQRKRRHLEQLIVDRKTIRHRYWRSERGWTDSRMSLADVLRISIKTNPRHLRNAPDLVIEGRNREIRLGWWLPRKSKQELKKLLLSIISDPGCLLGHEQAGRVKSSIFPDR